MVVVVVVVFRFFFVLVHTYMAFLKIGVEAAPGRLPVFTFEKSEGQGFFSFFLFATWCVALEQFVAFPME